MNKLFASVLLVLSGLLAVVSCDNLDENYGTSPSMHLSFSTDTLSFDTVFTTIGSATRQFMVYNRHSSPLMIDEVKLAGSERSGFRINVDGRKGDYFESVRIPAKDSLYVFVEVTVDPTHEDQPLLITDSVLFQTNGAWQAVRLEAYGQDVNICKGGVMLDKDTLLSANRPYLVYDSILIEKGTTVRIEEGAVFYFHDAAKLINAGSLLAEGTMNDSIVFRGDRLDDALDGRLPYDKAPSQWGGIVFKESSYDNLMDHVIVKNTTYGMVLDSSATDRVKLKIWNSQINNSGGNLLAAVSCRMEVVNTEISNAGGSVVFLQGGDYHFVHCSLVNYMSLVQRMQPCMTLVSTDHTSLKVSFDNTIVDGSFSSGKKPLAGELSLLSSESNPIVYRFNHCLLKSKEEKSEQFINTIFTDKSPSYRMKGKDENGFTFDFTPDSLTTLGVGKADLSIALQYPVDRLGRSRLTEKGPDIGAYEFVPKKEEEENKK